MDRATGVRSVGRRPMTAFGLALLALGAALAVVEAHVASYGVIGALAVAALGQPAACSSIIATAEQICPGVQ